MSEDISDTEWLNNSCFLCINLLTATLFVGIESISSIIQTASYTYLLYHSNLGILLAILIFTTLYANKKRTTLHYAQLCEHNSL